MSELKILIHIGNHLNVVNLLGACTKPNGTELAAPRSLVGGACWALYGRGLEGAEQEGGGGGVAAVRACPPTCRLSPSAWLLPYSRPPHGDRGVLQVRQSLQLLACQAGGLQPLCGKCEPC